MSTQFRIALFLIITNIMIVGLLGGGIYYFLYNYSYTDFYKRLKTRATISAKYNFDRNNINAESYQKIRQEHLEKLSEENEYLFEIKTESDLAGLSRQTALPLTFFKTIYQTGTENLQIKDVFYAGIRYDNPGKKYIVIVSAKNYYASHHLLFLRNIILVAVILVVAILAYLSFFFSKHIFDPIKDITSKVKKISTENIHLRIEEKDKDNEINRLISTFNDLLNRLETAFETQKNFVSNASHEFCNPLTAILGETEVILMKDRTPEEYRQSLNTILTQAERLNQITQTLLMLAQTGYSNKKVKFEVLRTDELLWNAKEMMDKLNPKNNIIIDYSLLPENPFKLKVLGNKQLLYLAFTNILTNACKYSNYQPVQVSIASNNNDVILIFKDQGIGIPESEMPFIYDPFFRASNTRQFEGYGIGLPLTRNIIKIHNGQLIVAAVENQGTTVQIKLPLAKIDLPAGTVQR